MFTFADQEKEFNRALRTERAEGEKKGEIIGAIKLYRDEMDLLPTDIIKKIMMRFCLEEAVAEKYVEETLGLQLA